MTEEQISKKIETKIKTFGLGKRISGTWSLEELVTIHVMYYRGDRITYIADAMKVDSTAISNLINRHRRMEILNHRDEGYKARGAKSSKVLVGKTNRRGM